MNRTINGRYTVVPTPKPMRRFMIAVFCVIAIIFSVGIGRATAPRVERTGQPQAVPTAQRIYLVIEPTPQSPTFLQDQAKQRGSLVQVLAPGEGPITVPDGPVSLGECWMNKTGHIACDKGGTFGPVIGAK